MPQRPGLALLLNLARPVPRLSRVSIVAREHKPPHLQELKFASVFRAMRGLRSHPSFVCLEMALRKHRQTNFNHRLGPHSECLCELASWSMEPSILDEDGLAGDVYHSFIGNSVNPIRPRFNQGTKASWTAPASPHAPAVHKDPPFLLTSAPLIGAFLFWSKSRLSSSLHRPPEAAQNDVFHRIQLQIVGRSPVGALSLGCCSKVSPLCFPPSGTSRHHF